MWQPPILILQKTYIKIMCMYLIMKYGSTYLIERFDEEYTECNLFILLEPHLTIAIGKLVKSYSN